MSSEKLVEKPISKSIKAEKIVDKEKVELPDKQFEKTTPLVEKIKKSIQPLEKSGEGDIVASSQAQDWQKQRAQAIDSILAEGLDEVFLNLKPEKQKEFKEKGEETVKKINILLGQTKVKVKKIINLIRAWLKIIPGVNKFFLEQESKIKADRIVKIKNKF